ncbi:MAG: hypothetical protein ACYDAR_18230 [Thermomicrobiales bacterium]
MGIPYGLADRAPVCDTDRVDMAIPPIACGALAHLTGHIPTTIE